MWASRQAIQVLTPLCGPDMMVEKDDPDGCAERIAGPTSGAGRDGRATMLQVLVNAAGRLLEDLNRSLLRDRLPAGTVSRPSGPPTRFTYETLEQVTLTD